MSTNIHSEGRAGSPSWPGLEREEHGQPAIPGLIEARPESRTYLRAGEAKARSESEPCLEIATQPSRLWLWFVAAFLIQAAAWTIWFTIASQHRIEEVQLVTRSSER
jgi:hypothetical protein